MEELTLAQLEALWKNGFVPTETDYIQLFKSLIALAQKRSLFGQFRYVDTIADNFSDINTVLDNLDAAIPYYLIRTSNGSTVFVCKPGDAAIEALTSCKMMLTNGSATFFNSPTQRFRPLTATTYELWSIPSTGITASTFTHNELYDFTFWRIKVTASGGGAAN